MKGAPSQTGQSGGFGQTGGSSGMPAWFGMAQQYFPQMFNAPGGGGLYQPNQAMPYQAGPPLGAQASSAGGVTAPAPTPPQPAGGLLGTGAPDGSGSGLPYGHGLISPGQWYNRGYGVPGVSPPGQSPPQSQTGFISPPAQSQTNYMPYGLFGSYM